MHMPSLRNFFQFPAALLTCACALLALSACNSKPAAGKSAIAKAASANATPQNGAEAPPPEAHSEMLVAKSVFDASPEAGRDPFFPGSSRRAVAVRTTPGPAGEVPFVASSGALRLAGIWPSKTRPVALINKTSFQPGETAEVAVEMLGADGTLAVRKLMIRCLEIRADSVLISVAGESGTKELRMANGL
jgi:hypothetical protein